jgi:hypothetical protein
MYPYPFDLRECNEENDKTVSWSTKEHFEKFTQLKKLRASPIRVSKRVS